MSGSEVRRRQHVVAFRLEEDEWAVLEHEAERHAMSAGQYARQALLESAGIGAPLVRRRPPPDHEALARILGHLGKIGGNVNQIARRPTEPWPDEIEAVRRELAGLRETVAAALHAPQRSGR